MGTRRQVLQAGVQQDFQRGLRDVVAGECVLQVQPVVLGVLQGRTHVSEVGAAYWHVSEDMGAPGDSH